ncbi:hypothetical protein D9619_006422 [Psilocybe cf. subviscida]|uniref:Cytochrome c oxidase assembly protein n=1 Tax=Psilocybe cf. subviscida TaxID=2480587 RepID=A0A8H5B6K5_9AGAR|nr:hypothetical protein D9619_006422 [Psilocybe cf. subviscida]
MADRRAKATLIGAVAFSALVIFGVHFQQHQERQTMYQGVLKDDERRRQKLEERRQEFLASQKKRELYESVQRVQPSEDTSPS